VCACLQAACQAQGTSTAPDIVQEVEKSFMAACINCTSCCQSHLGQVGCHGQVGVSAFGLIEPSSYAKMTGNQSQGRAQRPHNNVAGHTLHPHINSVRKTLLTDCIVSPLPEPILARCVLECLTREAKSPDCMAPCMAGPGNTGQNWPAL